MAQHCWTLIQWLFKETRQYCLWGKQTKWRCAENRENGGVVKTDNMAVCGNRQNSGVRKTEKMAVWGKPRKWRYIYIYISNHGSLSLSLKVQLSLSISQNTTRYQSTSCTENGHNRSLEFFLSPFGTQIKFCELRRFELRARIAA